MRSKYKAFLNKEDISHLYNTLTVNNKYYVLKTKNKIVDKIINKLKLDFDFTVKEESYFKIEQTGQEGHDWHVDTGSNNHMMWCELGGTILLKADYQGGKTYYKEDNKVVEVERSIGDLCAHKSDVEHKVDPTTGNRQVFLIFI
jgi:predicted 2-oxoglutarate/Fe(II)-dependent dioxygenase YbiX